MDHNNKKSLSIISLIAVVNALGYGIILPVIYTYAHEYGLSDFETGLLIAIFSICQFIATPIVGRLSDKYGRRPLLLGTIASAAVSFFMTAFAPSAFFIFLARALDGIASGNIPVASAVISDSMEKKDRARGFGIMGAAFAFGLVFGPAIAAATLTISPNLPFIIAGVISLISFVITYKFLPETNSGDQSKIELVEFRKLFVSLKDKTLGPTFLIAFFYSIAFSMLLYAFQPFALKSLEMSARQISLMFSMFGVLGIISQLLILPHIMKHFSAKKVFTYAIFTVAVIFGSLFFANSVRSFWIINIMLGLSNSVINPLVQTILSHATDQKSQGTILGINSAYMSIGQIIGPILGGAIASYDLSYPFLVGSFFAFCCYVLSFKLLGGRVGKAES